MYAYTGSQHVNKPKIVWFGIIPFIPAKKIHFTDWGLLDSDKIAVSDS